MRLTRGRTRGLFSYASEYSMGRVADASWGRGAPPGTFVGAAGPAAAHPSQVLAAAARLAGVPAPRHPRWRGVYGPGNDGSMFRSAAVGVAGATPGLARRKGVFRKELLFFAPVEKRLITIRKDPRGAGLWEVSGCRCRRPCRCRHRCRRGFRAGAPPT